MRTSERSSINPGHTQRPTLLDATAATIAAATLAVQARKRLRTSTRRLSTNPMYNGPGNSSRAVRPRAFCISHMKFTQELPYFALRPPWMAAHHFNAGFIVVSCAIGHVGYYRRTFRAQAWSDLRSYPKVTAKVMCVGLEFPAERDVVEARYPSFRSTPAEREALFGEFSLSLGSCGAASGKAPAEAALQRTNA